ncbi:MAG: hypothetical protein ABSA62_04525 [Methyloceanibacter sp.]
MAARAARVLAWIVGTAAIAVLFEFQWEAWLAVPLLFAALILAIGLSGHLIRGERNASFWLFNYRLWIAAAAGAARRGPVRGRPLHHPREGRHRRFSLESKS